MIYAPHLVVFMIASLFPIYSCLILSGMALIGCNRKLQEKTLQEYNEEEPVKNSLLQQSASPDKEITQKHPNHQYRQHYAIFLYYT